MIRPLLKWEDEAVIVRVEYDPKADAMYVWLRKARYEISEELADNVIIDLDKSGRIIGIEILDASKNLGKELVSIILRTEKLVPAA
jgi:uncharacterized protein YuzE